VFEYQHGFTVSILTTEAHGGAQRKTVNKIAGQRKSRDRFQRWQPG
jgi:hypothetical protein